MKSMILPLLIVSIASISAVEADAGKKKKTVYKCPQAVEGRFTYQSKPCPNTEDEPEKNELKIIPVNEEKVKAAREKLEKDLESHKTKKDKAAGIVRPELPIIIPIPAAKSPLPPPKSKRSAAEN